MGEHFQVATSGRSASRPRRPRLLIAYLALVAFVAFASGCSRDAAVPNAGAQLAGTSTVSTIPVDEGAPKDGGQLTFGIDAEPDGFDPTASQFAVHSSLIVSSMLESLATFDADKNPKPFLADTIVPNDNAQRWTITIKPNITFQDGAPFNADAVVANLNAERNGIGSIALKPITSVTAIDARTVEVRMSEPWASFPGILSGQGGYQLSPATLGKPETASSPVGTGPFSFERWDRGTAISVKKNPTYWQPGKPHLDGIQFRIITDPDARLNALASGDLTMMVTDKAQTIADYRAKPNYRTIVDANSDAKTVTMNESQPPFDNVDARRAVILATNSEELIDTLGNDLVKTANQPFPDTSPYHHPDSHYPSHDLDAAKRAVQGYTASTGKPLEFSLLAYADPSNQKLAQVLQEQWAQAGIKAQIRSVEQAQAIKDIIFGKFDAFIEQNFGYPDPDFNYLFWHSSFTGAPGTLSVNFPHTKLAALDKVLADGRASLDPQTRQNAYRMAGQILNDNSVYVWLYRYVAAIVAESRVHGLKGAEAGFATFTSKVWYPDLWLDPK